MADVSLGMKARGVCLAPLLNYGVPANQTLDIMLKDIDNQLSENQARLKECVLELMELSQNVSGAQEKFTNPAEAVAYIAENRLFDKEMCFDLDSDAVNKLLQNVLQMMEKNPGCEEKVLKQLFELCATEGVAIPYRPSGSDAVSHSVVSINTAVDASEQMSEKLWHDICMKMKQYYSDELKKIPFGEKRPVFSFSEGHAIHCIQSLCSLIACEKVWSLYHNIRTAQLAQCIQKCISQKSKKSVTISTISEQFTKLVNSIIYMMNDDFELFSSNVFANVISPMTGLSEIYSDALLDVVSGITSQILEEVGTGPVVKSPKIEKKKKDDREISKSPSDMGFLGHIKVGIMKPQSKSADNLLDEEDQQFSDLQVLPGGYLEPIVKFVEQLLVLSCHIDKLHGAIIWQTLGHAPTKKKSRGTLKGVLKVNTSNQPEEIKKLSPSTHTADNSGLLPDAIPPPFGATPAMVGQKPDSLNAEDVMLFEWRRNFTRLGPDLAKTVESHINNKAEQCLKQLDDYLTKHSELEMIKVSPDLIGGRLDYPVKVSKGVHDLLSEIKWLLPLAKAGPQTPFNIVRAGFIDATSVSLKNVNVKLKSTISDIGSKLPYRCLYSALATLAFIRNQILSIEAALDSEQHNSKKALPTLYSQYCQSVDNLSRQIIETHNNLMIATILHDAESNSWQDSKDFYEGERCSFSIHMWYSHLMALKSDLWITCPPKLAQSMFTAVLQESLSLLCQRYSQIKPSFRRTPQFRADITAILLCTSELLYYGTSSSVKYLDPVHTHQEHFNIHVYCSTLLAALAVVTAPIDNIYKVFKKGFKKKHSHSDEDSYRGYVSHWLSWIRPEVFPLGCKTPESLQTTSALYLQLQLLLTKPEPNWFLLIQILLMKGCTLPIMLLSCVAAQHVDSGSDKNSPVHASPKTQSRKDSHARDGIQASSSSDDAVVRRIFSVFITVLLQCSSFPTALTRVMIPVFDRSNTWNVFDVNYTVNWLDQLPPWLSAICQSLESFILRVINPGVHVILARHNEPVGTEPIALRLKQLPCGCPAACEPPLGNKGNKDILAEALYSTIMQLVEDIYTLPTAIMMFFKAAQRQAAQRGVNTPHSSLGIKVIALCLKLYLSDLKYIEKLVGKSLDSEVSDQLKMLAECVYHVLCAASYGKGSGTPRLAGMFMKANRTWVSDQLDILVDHFNNEVFDLTETEPLDDTPVEFAENLIMSEASAVLSLKTGEDNLRKVYNMICHNSSWIINQLDIKPILGQRPSPQKTLLTLNLEQKVPKEYNPLKEYCKLGNVPFDQAAIMNFPWDWSALLHSDLGLSQVGFRSLLFNRHDMQDDAYLEENEKKPVESLRRKFHADNDDL